MHWLPTITSQGQAIRLPVTPHDALLALTAVTELSPALRREAWLRSLLASPQVFVWLRLQFQEATNLSELLDQAAQGLKEFSPESGFGSPAGDTPSDFPDRATAVRDYWDAWEQVLAQNALPSPHLVTRARPSSRETSLPVSSAAVVSPPTNVKTDVLDILLRATLEAVRTWVPVDDEDQSQAAFPRWLRDWSPAVGAADRVIGQKFLAEWDRQSAGEAWQTLSNDVFPDRFAESLRQLVQSQALAKDFEREKLASLKQLAYGASHEVNNPLANIATRAQLLLAGERDESRKKHLKIIWQQAMRAHEMISDMMLFAHPPQPVLQVVNLADLVLQASREFEPWVREAGWSITCDADARDVFCLADSNQLISMLQSIVQNSIESQSAGNVRIACRRLNHELGLLQVIDNGPGISAETARHMFDPFYSGREAGRGLGFGLSKAWTIVQLHHGQIRVASQPHAGTTLSIELPLAHSDAAS